MNFTCTAVVKQDGKWWIGWIEEIPGVNCQESTREALMQSLRETLKEAIGLNRRQALAAAGDDYQEEPVVL
jgi:predicted RNase H-like HicB family nuclease